MAQLLPQTVCLHSEDNVRVARVDIEPGTGIVEMGIAAREKVPAGHKIASRLIRAQEPIRKYNTVIGHAGSDLPAGSWLHDHNIVSGELRKNYDFCSESRPLTPPREANHASFMGYARKSGRLGTRNYIGVFATVNCSASVAHKIAEWFTTERLSDYRNVDGVVAFAHGTGCGMENGEPIELLRRTMGGYAKHPNLAGIVMVGLGCERNQVRPLLDSQDLSESDMLRTFVIQEHGGTRSTVEAGIAAVREMLPEANRQSRVSVSAGELILGMQCGASDGFSSISANPALGAASDLLIRHGGTSVLSETPEIYGVEHLLTRRAVDRTVGEKLLEHIAWWEEYARGRDVQLNGNVTPGNRAGGLSNIVEKSLGALMKAGTAPLVDVYRYAEPILRRGLVFMDSPGYDPVSATGQVAGGANMICFTTGRGSTFGCKPVPSIKIATNTPMFKRLEEDMDVNCGLILDGERTIEQMGAEIFAAILDHASGKPTKSEALDIGRHEFVPWQIGITG